MSNSNFGLAKPLLEEIVPRSSCSGGKALLFSVLLGLAIAKLINLEPAHLIVQGAPIAMTSMTPSGVRALTVGPTAISQPRSFLLSQTSITGQKETSSQLLSAQRLPLVQRGSARMSTRASAFTFAAPPPAASRDLDKLLSDNADKLKDMSSITKEVGDYFDEAWLLGFLLANPNDIAAAKAAATSALKWSTGKGKPIFEAAKKAYKGASSGAAAGRWNNDPAWVNAPHLSKLLQYIDGDGDQINHITSTWGDICYILREAAVKEGIMQTVSVEELSEFFLYVRELNARWCYARTNTTRSICQVIALQDMDGVDGSQSDDFRKALTDAYEQTEALHPLVTGPTVLFNVPLQLKMANVFKPLFPKTMQAKIRMEDGRISGMKPLRAMKKRPLLQRTILDDLENMDPSIKELSIR